MYFLKCCSWTSALALVTVLETPGSDRGVSMRSSLGPQPLFLSGNERSEHEQETNQQSLVVFRPLLHVQAWKSSRMQTLFIFFSKVRSSDRPDDPEVANGSHLTTSWWPIANPGISSLSFLS